jgi:hypothetical protein
MVLIASLGDQPPDTPPSWSAVEITETLGDRFRTHDTEHFSIYYDTPYETLRPLTARLEGIYDAIERFSATLDSPIVVTQRRLPIILFARHEDFAAYAEKAGLSGGSVAGFYNPKTNVAAFVDVLDSPSLRPLHHEIKRLDAVLQNQNGPSAGGQPRMDAVNRLMVLRAQRDALVESFNRVVLQHEAAHQILFNLGVHVRGVRTPLWVVEGLACQFEVPQSDARGTLTRVNHMRLGDLRTALGAADKDKNAGALFPKAVANGNLLPLDELLTVEQFPGDQNHLTAGYSQAWALVHFLHRQRPGAFAKYLAVLASRKPGADVSSAQEMTDFETAFGSADEDFTRTWLTFMLRLRYDPNAR